MARTHRVIRMTRARWLVMVAASAALAVASPASADFSATHVTVPANLSHPLDNKDAPPSDMLHVAGTATGSGTTVTLDCVTPQGGAVALKTGVDASSGSFSADIPASGLPSSPCVIRALPSSVPNPDPSMAPGQTSVWDGPIILPGYRQTSYIGGNPANPAFEFMAGNVKSGGAWTYASAGGCPIYDGGVLDPTTFDISDDSLYCNAAFFDVNNAGHSPTRSQLVIDNRNAYLPADAQRVNQDATHFPALVTPVFTYDGSNGDLTLHYVEQIVRCDVTGADPYPADPGNCADFADTGVQLDTWITQNSDASTTSLIQRFSATDGNVHTIDALSDQEFFHTHSSGGVIFPWLGSSYQGYAAGTPIAPPPAGAGSMYGKNDLASGESTLAGVQGSITWAAAPESIRITQGTSESNSDFELAYHKTISPPAPMWLGWSFAVGETQSGITAAAHDAEASFTPHIAIIAPADGSSTSAATEHVIGTASDNSGDTVAVSVNGQSAIVDSGGNWSADVPLSPGANTLTATVTNRYGTSSSARRSVTRVAAGPSPVPSHVFHGARFRGSHTLRLNRHGNLVLGIACPVDSATACSGTASIASTSAVRAAGKRPRAKVLKVGSRKFKVAAGAAKKITIHVTAKARRYIKKHHKLRAKLTIASRDTATAAGKNKKITAKLAIKPAATKKHGR
jgi:hypothetical protein